MRLRPAFALLVALPSAAIAASVADGVYTAAQASRGRALYQASCASCHGGGLRGGDSAPALAGPQFLDNWRGQTVAALGRRIRTTMPLDNPNSLDAAAVADVMAYMLNVNRFPAGGAELAADAARQQISLGPAH